MTTKTLNFSVSGEFITNMARQSYWYEFRFDYAYDLLGTCIGITQEYIDGIIFGKYKLVGNSNDKEGVTLQEDKSDFNKTEEDNKQVHKRKNIIDAEKEESELAGKIFKYAEDCELLMEDELDFKHAKTSYFRDSGDSSVHVEVREKKEAKKSIDNMRLMQARLMSGSGILEVGEMLDEVVNEAVKPNVNSDYLEKNPKSIVHQLDKKEYKRLKEERNWHFNELMYFVKEYDENKLSTLTNNCYISPRGHIFNVPALSHTDYHSVVYTFWDKVLKSDKDSFGVGGDSDIIDVKGFISISQANMFSGNPRIRASHRGVQITEEQEKIIKTFCEGKSVINSMGLWTKDNIMRNYNDIIKAIKNQRREEGWKD